MHPVAHDLATGCAVALSAFVLVVREPQVDSAGVDVDDVAEQRQAHRAAFGVPAGEPGAPRGVPDQLRALLGRLLPQCPVGVEALCWVGFGHAVSGAQLGESVAAEFAVPGVGLSREVNRAVRSDVGVIGFHERGDQVNHEFDGFAGPRIVVGRPDVQGVEIRVEASLVIARHVECGSTLGGCLE